MDLDGTMAKDNGWKGIEHIGKPIDKMVERVKRWLKQGKTVKVFTARAEDPKSKPYIKDFCREVFGKVLPITNKKDKWMVELWDDRARRVEKNTGVEL